MTKLTFVFDCSKDVVMVTNFGAEMTKLPYFSDCNVAMPKCAVTATIMSLYIV